MTDPSTPKRRHCATCRELDLDGDGDDLDDDGNCMSCVAAAAEDDDREYHNMEVSQIYYERSGE